MQQFDTYFFDLDGTLIDSKPAIFKCIRYTLGKYGIEENDEAVLNSFIGPPLHISFEKYYGKHFKLPPGRAGWKLMEKYREMFGSSGLYECPLFPGVEDTLRELKRRGKKVALATSKVQSYTEKILTNLKIDSYFDIVQGAAADGSVCEKPDIIRLVLEKLPCNKALTVMVGDRKYDILGAKECGLKSIGVLYGYAVENELKDAGADFLVQCIEDILQ